MAQPGLSPSHNTTNYALTDSERQPFEGYICRIRDDKERGEAIQICQVESRMSQKDVYVVGPVHCELACGNLQH